MVNVDNSNWLGGGGGGDGGSIRPLARDPSARLEDG